MSKLAGSTFFVLFCIWYSSTDCVTLSSRLHYMMKRRVNITLEELIRTSKVPKKRIAKDMGISPQWLSVLLAKHPDDLTINQLRQIVQAIGLELTVSVEVKV